MALKEIGHNVTVPGKRWKDPDLTISVAKDLETVPGVPLSEEAVSFYDRAGCAPERGGGFVL